MTDGINGLQEFLQKLAWGGLENTTTFQMLYPDNTLAEQPIRKLIQDEIFLNDGDVTTCWSGHLRLYVLTAM